MVDGKQNAFKIILWVLWNLIIVLVNLWFSSKLLFLEAKSNERLIEIFEKEIEREIAEKMVAITEISKNIRKCQQNLDRLRKEAVTKFYMDSNKVCIDMVT